MFSAEYAASEFPHVELDPHPVGTRIASGVSTESAVAWGMGNRLGCLPEKEPYTAMQNVINLVMLVCAVFAALGFGVLSAYALCRFGFLCMRRHAASQAAAPALQSHPAPTN